jgi:hypothetical protein
VVLAVNVEIASAEGAQSPPHDRVASFQVLVGVVRLAVGLPTHFAQGNEDNKQLNTHNYLRHKPR